MKIYRLNENLSIRLKALQLYIYWGALKGLNSKGIAITCDPQTVINDKKVTDHHAVIPTRNLKDADLSALPAGEKAVLELVTLRLLCAVAQPHIYSETVAIAVCAGGEFTAKGKTVKHPGWKALEDAYRAKMKDAEPKKDGAEKALPELTEGQTLAVAAAIVKEGKSSPPQHFTEDTLLSAMETAGKENMPEDAERKGLGTPATRAGILEKLVSAGFLERKKSRKTVQLLPSHDAVSLITVLPEQLQSPLLTAEWEYRLGEIERGPVSYTHLEYAHSVGGSGESHQNGKAQITDLDRSKIEEQKKAVRAGYDMDIIPSDLATYGSEAKKLLQDLQSRNERMFLLTFLVLNTADNPRQLGNNIFQAGSIAQKYNCQLTRLDFQQEEGLMSCLPLGLNQIEIQRGLTTSSTAIFVPFTTQELFQNGKEALYYGINALSNNLIMVDRKLLKNPNGLILGTPGSGKSFSAKDVYKRQQGNWQSSCPYHADAPAFERKWTVGRKVPQGIRSGRELSLIHI